jgi:hypothetical protein
MGLVGLPGSVSLTVEGLKVADERPKPQASAAAGQGVTVTYTLKLSGPKGATASVKQTLTTVSKTDAKGKTHLVVVSAGPRLSFDVAAYFGKAGASKADADKVAEDIRNGSKWISGASVNVASSDSTLTLPDVETPVPGRLTTWREVVSESVAGSRTDWTVTASAGGSTYLTLQPASAVTTEPVAA